MGFLAKQILAIPGSQIIIELVFNLARVLTTLRCYRLQVENMDRIITVVKNWLDDPHANCKPNSNFKQYLKAKEFLAEDNYNLIEKLFFLKNWRLMVINFVGLGWVCVLCGVWMGQGAHVAFEQSSLKLEFDSPTSYFDFV